MKIRLQIFEGPLDLLIYLIKKNHLDVYDIPVFDVCQQYIDFLNLMKRLDIEVAGEYLAMAANLINIKSKMLLPKEEDADEPEQDPREELVQKIIEYEKFKEAASYLKEKEIERNKYKSRPSSYQLESEESFFEVSIFDLINAFKTALRDVPKEVFFEVAKDEFTVEEKMHEILHAFVDVNKVDLDYFCKNARNKMEIIATFLAILELIKLDEIVAVQESLFKPIVLVRKDFIGVNNE
jgi:segregation and condensation protein A